MTISNLRKWSVWIALAVWLESPIFTEEMMAAVINCVQTAPASAHLRQNRTTFRIPALRGNPPTRMLTKRKQERTETTRCVSLVCLCILCPQQCKKKKKTYWGRVERYFQWLPVASIRKGVIFVTIPPQNKVYLSVKRQRFTRIQMIT